MKSNKVAITVALCGNGTSKEMNPNVPLQPDELAEDIVSRISISVIKKA